MTEPAAANDDDDDDEDHDDERPAPAMSRLVRFKSARSA
jgi:hypothetical protein